MNTKTFNELEAEVREEIRKTLGISNYDLSDKVISAYINNVKKCPCHKGLINTVVSLLKSLLGFERKI